MYKPVRAVAFPMIVLAALTACGGGGGGGGVREVPFTSFSAVGPRQVVVMSGISETIGGTTDLNGVQVLSMDSSSVLDSASSTARLTYDGSGNLSEISVSTPQSSLSLGSQCSNGVCGGADATSSIAVIDPSAFLWNYQSFGVWLKGIGPTGFQAGAMSAGAVTPGSAVPQINSAIFTGLASGFYVDVNGNPWATAAVMTADTNFGTRRIEFRTANTNLVDLNDVLPQQFDVTGLNLSGLLEYGDGSSQFSGPVSTTGPALSGRATGQFFGPGAEEIGGVYSLTGAGVSRMIGGFGGKRP